MAENQNAKEHLDLVMLTHGWTRFDISRIYQEEPTTEWIDFEASQTITGSARRDVIGGLFRGRGNLSISLLVPEFAFSDVAYTDRDGRFRFEHFEFPDGTEFLLQSRGSEIFVDEEEFPAVNNFFIPTRTNNVSFFDNEQIEEVRRFMPDDGIWSLELEEFVVTERQVVQRFNIREVSQERLDQIWGGRLINLGRLLLYTGAAHSVADFDREGRVYRDVPTTMHGVPLVIYLDGVHIPFLFSGEVAVTMGNVVSIEVRENYITRHRFMPTTIALITTSSSFGRFVHQARLFPLGYQITQEFFSPAYTTPEQKANERVDLRATVFWNPSVTTEEDGRAEIHFYTSDNTGNYVVIIEGVTDDGGIVHLIERIR